MQGETYFLSLSREIEMKSTVAPVLRKGFLFSAMEIDSKIFGVEIEKNRPWENISSLSPDLSEIELQDIKRGYEEIRTGVAKIFTKAEDAIRWLRSDR